MTNITLNGDTLRYISLFETVTGARVKDCIEVPEKLIFIVMPGQISRAIGKKGENINKLKDMLKLAIHVIEYSENSETFIRNVFRNYNVQKVEIEQRGSIKHATVTVDPKEKAKAIGKDGKNLRLARDIVVRHHEVQSISIA